MKGNVFNIQRFCVNDGPGIRTTVFLKGCPLHCRWCHNPESHIVKPELFFYSSKCVMCGRCAIVCEQQAHTFSDKHIINREKCVVCGKCVEVCPTNAIEKVGYEITAEDVIEEVLKDRIFYEHSGGGLTLSGGEPLAQYEFSKDLLKSAKENNLHTCIETSGFGKSEYIKELSQYVDIFLYDWKITNEKKHLYYTGVSNQLIYENLRILDKKRANIILRCPIISGVNNDDEHIKGIATLLKEVKSIRRVEIEPYHSLGVDKFGRLDKEAINFDLMNEEQVHAFIARVQEKTNIPVLSHK